MPVAVREDASLDHLLGRLDVVRRRVAALVVARRAVDASPDDPFLGLYLSDDKIDELLRNDRVWVSDDVAAERRAAVESHADAAEARERCCGSGCSPAGSTSTTSTSSCCSPRWRRTSTTGSSATTGTSTTT